MDQTLIPEDPELVAKSALHALGDLISKCSPAHQPSKDVLDAFLRLYAEVRGTPENLQQAVGRMERALGAFAKAAIAQPTRWGQP